MALEWINFYEGIKGIDEKMLMLKFYTTCIQQLKHKNNRNHYLEFGSILKVKIQKLK